MTNSADQEGRETAQKNGAPEGAARRKPPLWPKLVALAFGLAFAAVIFEIGVLISVGEQAKFPRRVVGTDFGVRVNQPDSTYRHKSADGTFWFTINSKGLRADREYPYEKPAGVKRIVSLGDSFTAGYEVQGDETFSSVLEASLRERGVNVEVLNAGVSGYSNAEALVYLEREMSRYDPDLVLLSFYANDLVDNMRTGLFAIEDGQLVQKKDSYVPAGGLGNFFNTNSVFNWFSGYSNAFVFLKERLTHLIKRGMVEQNEAQIAQNSGAPQQVDAGPDSPDPQRLLTALILERFYDFTTARGIPLVIQSIPIPIAGDESRLVDVFPSEEFPTARARFAFVPMLEPLRAVAGQQPLYNKRSHGHWTAYAHALSGRRIANVIAEDGLLSR